MKFPLKKIILLLLSVSFFIILVILSNKFSSEEISKFISDTGIYAPIIYMLIQIVGQVFAPFSTSALFVAGYFLFGKSAIAYSIIIWTISSVINFILARKYGYTVLKFFLGTDGIKEVERIAERLTDGSLILLRLLTFYVNDFASYAFGLTKISFKKYMLATFISVIPWSLFMGIIIKNGDTLFLTTLKVLIAMIPFLILSYIFFKRKKVN